MQKRPTRYQWGGNTIYPHIAAGWQWSTQITLTGSGRYSLSVDVRNVTVKSSGCQIDTLCQLSGTVTYDVISNDGALHEGSALLHLEEGYDPMALKTLVVLRNSIEATGFVAEATEEGMRSFEESYWGQTANGVGPVSMLFDNTDQFRTGIALANQELGDPEDSLYPNVPVTITVKDANGSPIGSHIVTLVRGDHVGITLADVWPETVDMKGTLSFEAPVNNSVVGYPPPVAVMGFRFLITPRSQSFTSIPVWH